LFALNQRHDSELARIQQRLIKEANWQAGLVGVGMAIALVWISGFAIADKMKSPVQRAIEKQMEQIN
jgi:hypothetical protein